MRKLLIVLVLFCWETVAKAQKKVIDIGAIENWPVIDNQVQMSNDGKYVSYLSGSKKSGMFLILQATDNPWIMKVSRLRVNNSRFTSDNKRLIFNSDGQDSIGIIELSTKLIRYISQAEEFQLPENGDGKWMACRDRNREGIILTNFALGTEMHLPSVEDYLFEAKGHVLIMHSSTGKKQVVLWMNLKTGVIDTISRSGASHNFAFDQTGRSVAFLAVDRHNVATLKYYCAGMDSARTIACPNISPLEHMKVVRIREFSSKGDKLFFYVAPDYKVQDNQIGSNVTVKSSMDEIIKNEADASQRMAVAMVMQNFRVILLQKEKDQNCYLNTADDGEYILIKKLSHPEVYNADLEDFYTVSLKSGTRKLVIENLKEDEINFSPGGKFIYWYDRNQRNWYTYNLSTSLKQCVTSSIHVPLYFKPTTPGSATCVGIGAWLKDDEAVLIYDRFDIWKIDPNNSIPPINLTRCYGKEHGIELRRLDFNRESAKLLKSGDTLLLYGFDLRTKWNSLYQLVLKGSPKVNLLSNDKKLFYLNSSLDFPSITPGFYPVKAKDAPVYLFRRMTSSAYPNLYVTSDLKNYLQLTDFAPQLGFNWYTSELLKWRKVDGASTYGILYKPENFDPSRKYPVIFYYYEESSRGLNVFIHPDFAVGVINIPWFISHGYLVCVPDISSKTGYPGQSAYHAVLSAAKYLSKFSYVDKKHMGIQGHSYGGFETEYIVSHTNMFAAAAPSAGMADLTEDYLGSGRIQYYESGQGRIGAMLWKRPDLYRENSAIYNADKVTTPELLMHNFKDPIVNVRQAEEWVNALTRCGKKVWWLSYDNEGHILRQPENQKDYTIRLTQFFDHYLKDTQAPLWMTGSISPDRINTADALALDTIKNQP